MRKFNFALAPLVAFLGLTAAAPAFAADDASFVTGYENSWRGFRTFSIEFDRSIHSAVVHVTGVKNGKCIRPHSRVYVMDRKEASKENYTYGFNVNAGKGGVGGGLNAGLAVTREKPARFEFGFWDTSLRQVKYNVTFVRNGVARSTGWLPYNVHDNGGCIYNVGVRKSSKAP